MSLSVKDFLHSQLLADLPVPTADLTGQIIVVTGSNTGLGLESARHFARLHPKKLILAVRNLEKGKHAKSDIERSTKCAAGVIEVWEVDMASYASVEAFAQRLNTLDRLDALVENAGISETKYKRAEDNEATLTVNVVTTFQLALLALPVLQRTANEKNVQPRLTIVSSGAHPRANFPERNAKRIFDTLNDESSASMGGRYIVSKLIGLLVIRQLAPLMTKSTKPTVILNAVAPGLCKSSLMTREASFMQRIIFAIITTLIARETEKGARCIVAGAVAGSDTHGAYMNDCHVAE